MSYLAKGIWPRLLVLWILDCSITVDGLKSIVHTPWRKTKIIVTMIDKMSKTNALSVKIFAKQYHPDLLG
jgi:hypothetical protein